MQQKIASFFSTSDLQSACNQIEVEVDDKSKTAFTKPFGLYEFTRMPFELRNAPATKGDAGDFQKTDLSNYALLS